MKYRISDLQGKNKIKIDTQKYGEIEFEVENSQIKQGAKMSEESKLKYFQAGEMFKVNKNGTWRIGQVNNYADEMAIFWSDKITSINGDLRVPSNMTTLGNVTSISGKLQDRGYLLDLGELKHLGGELLLYKTKLKDLGKLETVGDDITISSGSIESLGKLKSVKGMYLTDLPSLTSLGNLEKSTGNITVDVYRLLTLGTLQTLGRTCTYTIHQ